jgi:tetratricopeptide (TPR) repeat protein
LNTAGVVAESDKDLNEAVRYHEEAERRWSLFVKLEKLDKEPWRDLAVAQGNLANVLKTQAMRSADADAARPGLIKALQVRENEIESWRKAKELNHNEASQRLSLGLSEIADQYSQIGRHYEAFVAAFDAYWSLSRLDRQPPQADWLKVTSRTLSGAIGPLYRERRDVIGPLETADACDVLAGHPSDPYSLGPGKDFTWMKADDALAACQMAVDRSPNTLRFIYQRARAFAKKGDRSAAITEFQRAADYPIASNNLAFMFGQSDASAERAQVPDLYLQYFNRVVGCCGREAAQHILEQATGAARNKLVRGAIEIIRWAAELGDATAHEKLATIVGDDAAVKVGVSWESASSEERNSLAVMHLRLAQMLYQKNNRENDARRVSAMLPDLSQKMSEQQLDDIEQKVSAWNSKEMTDAPEWMIPWWLKGKEIESRQSK